MKINVASYEKIRPGNIAQFWNKFCLVGYCEKSKEFYLVNLETGLTEHQYLTDTVEDFLRDIGATIYDGRDCTFTVAAASK